MVLNGQTSPAELKKKNLCKNKRLLQIYLKEVSTYAAFHEFNVILGTELGLWF